MCCSFCKGRPTQRRSIAESVGCFQRRLFVCLSYQLTRSTDTSDWGRITIPPSVAPLI